MTHKVTDEFGCSDSTSAAVNVYPLPISGLSNDENPNYIYKTEGLFTITLISISDKGCTDTTYKKIEVKDENEVYIPNSFTPNGDGKNDVFAPIVLGVKEFKMLIFDRWGMNIFQTSDLNKLWDGKIQDRKLPCQGDTYVYLIDITFNSGAVKNYKGKVSLTR